ncbi:MAG: hypothetical protein JWQ71_3664, partial [Pedosphaera sp.]|nr:hypothetical protein [Pedosphaera sp.]
GARDRLFAEYNHVRRISFGALCLGGTQALSH